MVVCVIFVVIYSTFDWSIGSIWATDYIWFIKIGHDYFAGDVCKIQSFLGSPNLQNKELDKCDLDEQQKCTDFNVLKEATVRYVQHEPKVAKYSEASLHVRPIRLSPKMKLLNKAK